MNQRKEKVIFDTTVFNIAARIKCCDLVELSCSFLFDKILVPQEITDEIGETIEPNRGIIEEKDFERRMQTYFRDIQGSKKNLEFCTTYDTIDIAFLKTYKNIDKGEAAAVAQAQKRSVRLIFTDDLRFIDVLKEVKPNVICMETIRLIAMLDVAGILADYRQTIEEFLAYKPLPKNGGKKKFREEYEAALKYFGQPSNKKKLNEKTSFKALGLDS